MDCNTNKKQGRGQFIARDYGASGVLYEVGSVYGRMLKLSDIRKARGKLYRLEDVLMIIVLAKLCGEDRPSGIAEWAKNHQELLVQLLHWSRPVFPSHSTYRRILAYVVYQEEVEQLVGEYNQAGEHGEVYAMVGLEPTTLDGKAPRGMRKKDDDFSEYLLSVYDVEQSKVLSQVAVGRKENEITKAPKVLENVKIKGKIITADAMHTQRRLSAVITEQGADYVFPVKENQPALYQSIQQLFAPEYPEPGFGKIQTDFLTAEKVNKGQSGSVVQNHGRLETRKITTSEMLNAYSTWPGLSQVYRLERHFQWFRSGHCYHTSRETEWGITSLDRTQASPLHLLKVRRAHWGIENGLHGRRDVTFHEDATRKVVL